MLNGDGFIFSDSPIFIWQWVKTLVPFCSPQNSWDLWMFIPLKMVLIGIDPILIYQWPFVREYSPKIWPYMVLTYLHFRILKFPLNIYIYTYIYIFGDWFTFQRSTDFPSHAHLVPSGRGWTPFFPRKATSAAAQETANPRLGVASTISNSNEPSICNSTVSGSLLLLSSIIDIWLVVWNMTFIFSISYMGCHLSH